MKVAELFESKPLDTADVKKIKYEDVSAFVLKLVLKSLHGLTPDVIHDIKVNYENDRFWTENIHQILPEIEAWVGGSDNHSTEDEIYNTVEEVCTKIVDYYDNSWNHEPGAKLPKLSYDEGGLGFTEFEKLLQAAFPVTKLAKDRDNEHRKEQAALWAKRDKAERAKSRKPESVAEVAKAVDKAWTSVFNPKMYATLAKDPERYDFDKGFAPKNARDIGERNQQLHDKNHKYTLAYHVFEYFMRFAGDDMDYEEVTALRHIGKSPKSFAQLVAASKQLQKFA
jgi:hypothetical protein